MAQPDLRRRMRGNDAMFLYFERKEMPLHIGCVAVLDGPFDEESEEVLAARLPEIPRYRQRVMFSPYNITHPSWEFDPDFDISNHIRRVRLDPPGTDRQLSDLAGQVFTPVMDRNKPLWDLTIVDGLEHNRSALIVRVHHSIVDGVSGIGLAGIMFDPTRQPRAVEPQPFNPPPLPDERELLVEGLAGLWADAAERLIGTQLTLMRLAMAFTGNDYKTSLQALLATIPDLIKPTERLPFNGPCSGVRGHCWTSTPFGEARAIRSAVGGTINDVVLTAVAGAISRYVVAHNEPLRGRFVRLMVPVNLRTEDPNGRVGNEISMLPLSIPLDIEDPVERMKVIAMRTAAMKTARIADIIQLIGIWLGWTPPTLQHSLAALPFMPQGPVRIVNMVCTNVPGPMIPLYANGRELLTYYPHVPCGSEVGISIAISSYNHNLYYGVTYDAQAAPDGELFRDFVAESYEELREAAGVRPVAASSTTPRPEAASTTAASDLRAHRAAEPPPTTPEAAPPKQPESPSPEHEPADSVAAAQTITEAEPQPEPEPVTEHEPADSVIPAPAVRPTQAEPEPEAAPVAHAVNGTSRKKPSAKKQSKTRKQSRGKSPKVLAGTN
jgi:diacylglycerol O-acyltransferase